MCDPNDEIYLYYIIKILKIKANAFIVFMVKFKHKKCRVINEGCKKSPW
jgi:hypothetical protein